MKPRVLVVGDLMLDCYVIGMIHRTAAEAPVPVFHERARVHQLGGAANTAHSLAQLGAAVTLCGVVGRDPDGRYLRQHCRCAGISTAWILSVNHETTVKTRFEDRTRQTLLLRHDRDLTPENTQSANLEGLFRREPGLKPDAIVLSDYGKGVVSPGVVQAVQATEALRIMAPKPPALWLDRPCAGLLVLNEHEARTLARGKPDRPLEDVIASLQKRYQPSSLVVTRGAAGAVLGQGSDLMTIPCPDLGPALNVCGAGDAFLATLTWALLRHDDIQQAVATAVYVATATVTRSGTSVARSEDFSAALRWVRQRSSPPGNSAGPAPQQGSPR